LQYADDIFAASIATIAQVSPLSIAVNFNCDDNASAACGLCATSTKTGG